MIDMADKEILPSVMKYSDFVAGNIAKLAGLEGVDTEYQKSLLKKLSLNINAGGKLSDKLKKTLNEYPDISADDIYETACYYRDTILPVMRELRSVCDALEEITDKSYWPIPSYSDILFYL